MLAVSMTRVRSDVTRKNLCIVPNLTFVPKGDVCVYVWCVCVCVCVCNQPRVSCKHDTR